MHMRRRVAPAARTRPMVPVEPTADGPALYSAVQLRRGPRTAHGPSWSRRRQCPAEHAARCRSCGVDDGVVNQVGPSDTARGSSELVKAHTPRRGRPSCRNTRDPLGAAGCERVEGAAWLGEETSQSINPHIVCESHRHSLFSGRSTAAAETVCRLYWSRHAMSQAL